MIEIKKVPLSRLFNEEIPIFMKEAIEVFEQYPNLEELSLHTEFDMLVKQLPAAQTLETSYGKHRLTQELRELHKKRLKYASLINMYVKAMMNVDDEKTQLIASIARTLSKEQLAYLGQHSRAYAGARLSQFFYILETESNKELLNAFKELGLQPYLNELKETNIEYNRVFNERKNNIEQRPPTGDPRIRRESLRIIRLVLDKISSNQIIYTDNDYSEIIHELNIQLTSYSKRIKTRIATNKRRARKKKEAEEDSNKKKKK